MRRTHLRSVRAAAAVCIAGFAVSLTAAMPASADSTKTFTDNALTYEVISGGVRVIDAEAKLVKVNVPKEVSGYAVIEIGEYAFSDCTELTEATVQADLKKIGEGAFSECAQLTTLTFSGDVQKIGDGAFYYCASLENLKLPDSVTEIGTYAFGYCFSLKEFTIPRSVKILPQNAFDYDFTLEQVHLQEGLEEISGAAFIGCDALKKLEIPASVTNISPLLAVSCGSLAEIRVAEGNTGYRTDGNGALTDIDGKMYLLYPAGAPAASCTVPEGVTAIAPYAFSGAANLTEIKLPASVSVLGEGAFSNCKQLTGIALPAAVREIPASAFADTGLTAFTIPDTVTKIGAFSFYRCKSLTAIEIPASVTDVAEQAFCGCSGLKEVYLPDTVTTIGDYAFGFEPPAQGASDDTPVLAEGFTLRGEAGSVAKIYASNAKVRFRQKGISTEQIAIAAGIVVAAALIALIVVRIVRGSRRDAEKQPAPAKEVRDSDYKGILGDDSEESEKIESEESPND